MGGPASSTSWQVRPDILRFHLLDRIGTGFHPIGVLGPGFHLIGVLGPGFHLVNVVGPGFARTGAVLSSVTGCLVFQSGLLLRFRFG